MVVSRGVGLWLTCVFCSFCFNYILLYIASSLGRIVWAQTFVLRKTKGSVLLGLVYVGFRF